MKPEIFDVFATLLKSTSGLSITPDKAYLLESRLAPIARKWELKNIEELALAVRMKPSTHEMTNDVMEAMTTNETSFFRDNHPFEVFKNVMLPHLLEARSPQRRIRIWSAAASSGQESYSISMTIKEMGASTAGWSFPHKATDISQEIIEQAKRATYSQFEVQRGLPIKMLMSYFEQQEENSWKLKPEIREMVDFSTFNLLHDFAPIGRQDIIFCRNVLIYFDEATKSNVLERLAATLEDDGFLLLGGAETVLGLTDALAPIPGQRGLYAKKGSIHLSADSPLAKLRV